MSHFETNSSFYRQTARQRADMVAAKRRWMAVGPAVLGPTMKGTLCRTRSEEFRVRRTWDVRHHLPISKTFKKFDLLLKMIKYEIYQTECSFLREGKLVLETHSAGNPVTNKKQASDNSGEDSSLNACMCVLGNVYVGLSLMRQPKAKFY